MPILKTIKTSNNKNINNNSSKLKLILFLKIGLIKNYYKILFI